MDTGSTPVTRSKKTHIVNTLARSKVLFVQSYKQGVEDIHGFQLVMNFLIMPVFFLSGALFPLEGLSGALLTIARIDPLSYGVDGLRGTLVNASHFGLSTDLLILSVITLLTLGIGSYLFSKIEI